MAKGIHSPILKPVTEAISFDELEKAGDDSRTGNDNRFIKRIGSNDYLFNRVIIPADKIDAMIENHPLNPRVQKFLNKVSLAKLMSEISKTNGVQQPPVCTYSNGKYQTIDGSRRTMASKLLGLPITIEYTADFVSDEDASAYILATDTNENQSAYENAVDLYNRYVDFKSDWEKNVGGKWNDTLFIAEENCSGSTLTRSKRIATSLNEKFFLQGDPNKFASRDLISFISMKAKPEINFKDTFFERLNNVFKSCLEQCGEDWDFSDFKKLFNTEFGIKQSEKRSNKDVLCVVTVEAGDDFEDLNVTLAKKSKSFSVEFPFEFTEAIESKLRDFIVKEFDNN
ncbi:hypothetical protein [Photobacterium damselae]|uniref:hypothetical protein n=1 Tax=Photobacterium damselae TaxID=38293 RepID=UPI0040688659